MSLSKQIAKHFREVHFGGNWTAVNLKEQLSDVSWQQATTEISSFNTIAALAYHINYYVSAVLNVLKGGSLDAHDKYSFDHPPVRSAEDWQRLADKLWADAEQFAMLVEQLPDSKLDENFLDGKYGTWYRNLAGLIEHCHYHLGQIVVIKKLLTQKE